MKILHLSDLHRVETDYYAIEEQTRWIRSLFVEKIDLVVITGDIFESINYKNDRKFSVYKRLSAIFEDTPVICTLGNHEFFHITPEETRKFYKDNYKPKKYNVHYLDIIGFYDVGNYRFLGNCFWYDGSMKTISSQKVEDMADGKWADKLIKDFDYEKECSLCKIQIDENKSHDKMNILCTHTVPHWKLNGHMKNDIVYSSGFGNDSWFNAYSGIKTYLDDNKFDYNLSGHTHERVTAEINGCKCYNTGNDYFPPFNHFIIDLED